VSTDGGASWKIAQLQEPVMEKCLTRFTLPWRWDGKAAVLQSRARDDTGYWQPTHDDLVAARGLNSGYHYNGIHGWAVDANGALTNAG